MRREVANMNLLVPRLLLYGSKFFELAMAACKIIPDLKALFQVYTLVQLPHSGFRKSRLTASKNYKFATTTTSRRPGHLRPPQGGS